MHTPSLALYHAFPTRSCLIRFVLEELALPHELIRVDAASGAHKQPTYAGPIHPHGRLPALAIDGVPIHESVALALYLADLRPDATPPLGTLERARYYQWCVYAIVTELPPLSKIAMNTQFLPEALRRPEVAAEGRVEFAEVVPVLARAVANQPFLLGSSFSVADAMVGGCLWLAELVGELARHPDLHSYYDRIKSRPAFTRAFQP